MNAYREWVLENYGYPQGMMTATEGFAMTENAWNAALEHAAKVAERGTAVHPEPNGKHSIRLRIAAAILKERV